MARRGSYPTPTPFGLQYDANVQKQLKGRLPKDAYGVRVYDTKLLKAGQVTPQQEFRFFSVPIGQQDFVVNAPAEVYQKTKFHTDLNASGLLEQGQMLIIRNIQLMVIVPSQTDTTYPTSGPGTEQTTNPAAAAAVSGVNLATAILNQSWYQIIIGEHGYESGIGFMWPSRYGMSGFAGFGISTDFEGVANNGFGQPWMLPIERQIPALTTFYLSAQFLQGLTITRNVNLVAIMEGIKYRPVA